jgi:hypothetical protein
LKKKLIETAKLLYKTDEELKQNPQKAIGRVIKHYKEIGDKDWNNIFKLYKQNPLGIQAYSFFTYHILIENMSFHETLEKWDRTR